MTRTIDVADTHALIVTRKQLRARGCGEREIQRLVESGAYLRVRNNRYVEAGDWNELWNEGRHLVEVVATHLNSKAPGPVFWGPSAAVLHGLPLYRTAPRNVHASILGARHGRTVAGVIWHKVDLDPVDVVEIGGIRCTSLDRTILDLARTTSAAVSLAAADAALRSEAMRGHEFDPESQLAWKERMLARAEPLHGRGIRRARKLITLADGRAQLPGESVSRLHLLNLGFAEPDLQVHVVGALGDDYWLDFGFRQSRSFGEFDGTAKYLDEEMRRGMTVEEVVLAEKAREDDIRGVTGWRFARWGSADIATAATLGAKLAAYGIRPPG